MTPAPAVLVERPVQLRGSALGAAALRAAGWRIDYTGLPARQGVVIVYPHTSNWDFPVGLLTKWAIGFPVHFWGKDTLFKLPLVGHFMRWVGGVAIDRTSPHGVVEQMIERMNKARQDDEFFWLALAPEGTRGRVDFWRSGFYRVAHQAGVPLALAYFDFAERTIGMNMFVRLSGDADADMAFIAGYLGHRRGKIAANAGPVRLAPATPPRTKEPSQT